MKTILFYALAIVAMSFAASCGSSNGTQVDATDSIAADTTIVVDSAAVADTVAVDTVVAE